jgi:SAM-dependent methyltransferase
MQHRSDRLEDVRLFERSYGEAWAKRYDEIHPDVDESAIDFLELISLPSRRVLELAVGTGRVAIPLARRGVEVTGVDISEAMLERMRAKPGGEAVSAVVGDMVEVPVEGRFNAVFIAFNSFFAVSSQQRQIDCFCNVARRLEPNGRFVLECFVPDMKRFDDSHRYVSESSVDPDGTEKYEVSVHDPVTQKIESQHIWRTRDGETSMLPVHIRYSWLAELYVMARLAGLELEQRFEWYDRVEYRADSGRHVSVYRKTSRGPGD